MSTAAAPTGCGDVRLIRAAMVADGRGVAAAPGAVLLAGDRILAAGTPQAVGMPAGATLVDLPRALLLPALVNVHCHLDLTHIGPVASPADFATWIAGVRSRRAVDDDAIAASVRRGVELSRAGGVGLVGDIAGSGSTVPLSVLAASGMGGVSFIEVFGLGDRQPAAVARMAAALQARPAADRGVRLGLQPHAPYSCGAEVYRAAARLGAPLSTHLAETLGEIEFVRSGTGPLAAMLRGIEGAGGWDGRAPGAPHPIDLLGGFLAGRPVIAAHLNYVEDRHLEMLARWPVTVAYCPRASAYFGHPAEGYPPHRYREMLDASIDVALGTDSILCLDRDDRLSVLDDMRLLWRRDGTEPRVLLGMGTIAGAAALGFDTGLVTLDPGPTLGLVAVALTGADEDPLRDAMRRDEAPSWVAGPFRSPEPAPAGSAR